MERPETALVSTPQIITPSWPAPAQIFAASTTRKGGKSDGPFDSLNLGTHVGDNPNRVEANRRLLQQHLRLPAEPFWLQQVHGCDVLYVEAAVADKIVNGAAVTASAACPVADAVWTDQTGVVLTIMTADCLPVLVASKCGTVIAAIHGGWRGLAAGILQKTVAKLPVPASQLVAWMGPAIGPDKFEVGLEVREVFEQQQGANILSCFKPSTVEKNKCFADIFTIAELLLKEAGVTNVYSDRVCTVSREDHFFSHRRDCGNSGRMASLIWRV